MILSLIVAADENNVIGKDNTLPWHLPDEMQFFREKTKGHSVIMGRKNHESIGRVLPNRRNIVITRQKDYQSDGCEVVHSLDEAIDLVRDEDEVFVIGGGEIYKQAMTQADRLYFTRVHQSFDGDVMFPEIDVATWKETERREHPADEQHECAFTFLTYEKA